MLFCACSGRQFSSVLPYQWVPHTMAVVAPPIGATVQLILMPGLLYSTRYNVLCCYLLTERCKKRDDITLQVCQWIHILNTAWRVEGLSNKLSVFVKGPGWEPGKPRLGYIEDIPNVSSAFLQLNNDLLYLFVKTKVWVPVFPPQINLLLTLISWWS